MAVKSGGPIEVGGHRLKIGSLDRVVFPRAGVTKADVLDYYVRVASTMLPHLRERLLHMHRYPEGVEGPRFWQKGCPEHRPDWMAVAPVWSEAKGATIDFCVVNELASLLWAVNLGSIELHTSLHTRDAMDRPPVLAFDLDPGEGVDVLARGEVALRLRALLDGVGLCGFVKTSGSKGQVISRMARAERRGRVLVDWGRTPSTSPWPASTRKPAPTGCGAQGAISAPGAPRSPGLTTEGRRSSATSRREPEQERAHRRSAASSRTRLAAGCGRATSAGKSKRPSTRTTISPSKTARVGAVSSSAAAISGNRPLRRRAWRRTPFTAPTRRARSARAEPARKGCYSPRRPRARYPKPPPKRSSRSRTMRTIVRMST